jgi:hypothetical protein
MELTVVSKRLLDRYILASLELIIYAVLYSVVSIPSLWLEYMLRLPIKNHHH